MAQAILDVAEIEFALGDGGEWPFKDFGKDEIVFRAERETNDVEQVLHGERVEQADAVGAGNGDILALQRLQDAVEQAAGAAAHQDEEVAGPGRTNLDKRSRKPFELAGTHLINSRR